MGELLLPVFPLNVVLFPRTDIPLHIFEERYKEMIGECIENRSEFGIVLALEEGIASTGCTASVAEVFRRFDDGRMDIRARGQRRFELQRLDQERAFLRGEVQFFDDEGGEVSREDPLRRQALQLFQQLAERLSSERGGESAGKPEPPESGDPQLSFQIASRLPVELSFRQGLLQLRSEAERLRMVVSYLEKLAAQVAHTAAARTRAGANGATH